MLLVLILFSPLINWHAMWEKSSHSKCVQNRWICVSTWVPLRIDLHSKKRRSIAIRRHTGKILIRICIHRRHSRSIRFDSISSPLNTMPNPKRRTNDSKQSCLFAFELSVSVSHWVVTYFQRAKKTEKPEKKRQKSLLYWNTFHRSLSFLSLLWLLNRLKLRQTQVISDWRLISNHSIHSCWMRLFTSYQWMNINRWTHTTKNDHPQSSETLKCQTLRHYTIKLRNLV